MKRRNKKGSGIVAYLLAFMMIFTMMPGMVFATGGQTDGQTVRLTVNFDVSSFCSEEMLDDLALEKVSSQTVEVPIGTTLQNALVKLDDENQNIEFTGADTGYIVKIDEYAANSQNVQTAYNSLLQKLGISSSPTEFQYAGWMYSSDKLTGNGITSDVIEEDTVVDFRYALYYGAKSSNEWVAFDWEFLDAYNQLNDKLQAAKAIANGNFEGFSEAEKTALETEIAAAESLKTDIDDEAVGIWAAYFAEKKATLWGPDSPTDKLQKSYKDLSDAVNKTPAPTGISITAVKNGTDELDVSKKFTVKVGDEIQLMTKVLPEGTNQGVSYEVLPGDDALTISPEGLITCEAVTTMGMVKVTSLRNSNITKVLNLEIKEAKYSITFMEKDGVTLTADDVILKNGAGAEITGTASGNEIVFSDLVPGNYEYAINIGDYSQNGTVAVKNRDIKISVEAMKKQAEINPLIDNIAASYKNASSDWEVMDMAAYAKYNPDTTNKTTDKARQEFIDSAIQTVLTSTKDTDISKALIALTAIGGDITQMYPANSDTPVNGIDKLNDVEQSTSLWRAPYTLIAYNQGNYNSEAGEEALVDEILKAQNSDGSWEEWGTTVDTTANAIAALAFYDDRQDVQDAIDKGIEYLSTQQKDSGAFDGGYGVNSNSTAMVIIGLAAAGIDPATDARFIKNGNSVLDGLLEYKMADNSGFGFTDNKTFSGLATEQSFRALIAAAQVMKTGKAYNVYDFSDNEVKPVTATEVVKPETPGTSGEDNKGNVADSNANTGDDSLAAIFFVIALLAAVCAAAVCMHRRAS